MHVQLTSAALLPKKAGKKGRRAVVDADADKAQQGPDKLEWMVGQLLNMLHSPTPATICGGARALRVIAESRAHAAHAAGDAFEEEPSLTALFTVRTPARKRLFRDAATWGSNDPERCSRFRCVQPG